MPASFALFIINFGILPQQSNGNLNLYIAQTSLCEISSFFLDLCYIMYKLNYDKNLLFKFMYIMLLITYIISRLINFPYVDSVREPTLSSKNQSSVGPVIIKIPIAIMNKPENLGIKLRVILFLRESSVLETVGSATNAKNMTPPIQIDDNRL